MAAKAVHPYWKFAAACGKLSRTGAANKAAETPREGKGARKTGNGLSLNSVGGRASLMSIDLIEKLTSIGASIATVVALYAIYQQVRESQLNRARQSIDFLTQAMRDFREVRSPYLALVKQRQNLDVAQISDQDSIAIVDLLNWYEQIAILIRRKQLDEEMAAAQMRQQFLLDWTRTAPFVNGVQKRLNTVAPWAECRWLSQKWAKA